MAEIEQQPMESIQEEDSTSDADEDEDVESSHQRRPDHATNGHTPLGLLHDSRGPNAAQPDEGSQGLEEDGSSSVCDFEAGPFSAKDRDVAAAGQALMGVAANTLKLLSRHLLLGALDPCAPPACDPISEERKGKERKGKERKGKERKGKVA
eukprot:1142196-Pelagomonas_calceolata.AAC.5